MNGWVLLLRGINVGGRNLLPMAKLRALLGELGVREIASSVQSGNVVFDGIIAADSFEEIVETEIAARFGFRPRALVLSAESFREIAAAYPFEAAQDAPKTGHIWFCSAPPRGDAEKMEALAAPSERFAFGPNNAFFLHAPEGIGRSVLAARAEKILGVPATARNLNTVDRLLALLDAMEAAH